MLFYDIHILNQISYHILPISCYACNRLWRQCLLTLCKHILMLQTLYSIWYYLRYIIFGYSSYIIPFFWLNHFTLLFCVGFPLPTPLWVIFIAFNCHCEKLLSHLMAQSVLCMLYFLSLPLKIKNPFLHYSAT